MNVRYWPYCLAEEFGFAKNCVNFYGTQLDPWEWSLAATNRLPMDKIKQLGGIHEANMAHADQIGQSRRNEKCDTCKFNKICEGIPEQYQHRFGIDELKPLAGEPITDYSYFEKGGAWS